MRATLMVGAVGRREILYMDLIVPSVIRNKQNGYGDRNTNFGHTLDPGGS
jgi:hypothetical protein